MPPTKECQSLYFQCLNRVFDNVFDELSCGISYANFERMRKYYVTNLHGGIREHILKLAVLKDKNRIQFLLQLINLLVDSNINYLYTISGEGFLLPKHYSTLISHLSQRDCTGLKSLYIRVRYERPEVKDKDPVIRTNVALFHSLLSRGLAKSLTVLVLGKCCDNAILRIIGKHCVHLTKLDIVASWAVNDDGFKYLCLKNPNSLQGIKDGEQCTPQQILEMMNMKANRLNPCCFTLCDIRIQETNTSDVTVIMLLIFIKNLRTFGGFIYFRSVGDSIAYLSEIARGKLKLNLTNLHDTHLTENKVDQLSLMIPNLTSLYTRSIYVQPLLRVFRNLNNITIDFDYQPSSEDNFYKFLSISGHQLKRIHLVDKNGFLDIISVFKLCPNLNEIEGSVAVHDTKRELPVPKLKKAYLKIMKSSAIQWVLMNAPNLEYLEVDALNCHYTYSDTESSLFDSRFFKNTVKLKPDCFDTLQFFIVHAPFPHSFSRKSIMRFILQCKKLQLIGDLASWAVSEKTVKLIKKQLKIRNHDVTIIYNDDRKADITMQSLKSFNL